MPKRLTAEEKYPDLNVKLYLDPDHPIKAKDLQAFRDRIKICGGMVYTGQNYIEIDFDCHDFAKKQSRNAGPKHKAILLKETDDFVKYADIVYWRYGLQESWDTIAEKLSCSRSAFFKRKKYFFDENVLFHEYLDKVDTSRAGDYEYLKTIFRWDDVFF